MSNLKTRILVVEDNLQDFIIFKEVLGQIRDFFIQIEHAETLQNTLKIIENGDFDIIFLDLFLPDSFGQDTFAQVRAKATAPIVILSGLSDKSTALQIVKQGAQDYIVKGEFDANLLEKAIVYSIERKKYQEELEQSERRNRTIFESIGIAIAEYDYTELYHFISEFKDSGKPLDELLNFDFKGVFELRKKMEVLNLNPEALLLYGCKDTEEFRKCHREFYREESVDYFKAVLDAIWNGDEELVYEVPFQKGGGIIHTLKRWRFLGQQSGFYRLLVSTEDVTELKKNQEKIYRQSVLMETVARATTVLLGDGNVRDRVDQAMAFTGPVFDADKLAVFLFRPASNDDLIYTIAGYWDAENRPYVGDNEQYASVYELGPIIEALSSGRPIELFARGSKDGVRQLLDRHQIVKAVVAPMKVRDMTAGVVILGYESEKPTDESVISGLMNLSGNIGAAISTYNAQQQLKEMNEDLEQRVDDRTYKMRQAIKELESFSYSVSHDLRAPLRAISGFSGVLEEEYRDKLDEQGQHYLQVIARGAGEMSQLIEDLLDFSRLGRKKLTFSEVNMNELVDNVISELLTQAPDRKIVFETEELMPCQGDHNMLRQVFVNFIWNAIKFTSKEDQAVIALRSRDADRFVEYEIEDNGVGFDMAYVEKLFGVFQRLHPHEDFEGTGVGLAIVQRVITRHGGRIEAYGEEGKGAKFTFTLPKVGVDVEELTLEDEELASKL